MTAYRRQFTASALAVLLLASVLLLLYIDHNTTPAVPEIIALRNVRVFSPPPPPPPAPVARENITRPASPDMSAINIMADVNLDTMPINISLQPGEMTGESGFNGDIGVEWGGVVDLSQLDAYPTPVNNPLYVFSDQAIARKISVIEARLHIAIDEKGKAYLINIVSLSFPAEKPQLEDFVSRIQFTPPTLLGVPVRTEYIWPVHLELE